MKQCRVLGVNLVLLIAVLLFSKPQAIAQQNVGIGIVNPHPSAILHLADTLGKGLLIPRTDTNAVAAFVNSMTPSPGIANGLLIYQKTDNIFYYYDGDASRWTPLSGVVGPTGPKGPTGFTGPRGASGTFGTIRDTNFSVLPTDQYGNYFLDMTSSRLFEMNKLGSSWNAVSSTNPAAPPVVRWSSVIQGGYTEKLSSNALLTDVFPGAGTTFNYKTLPGLRAVIPVGIDSLGYAIIRAYGTTRKVNPNNDYNYAIYTIRVNNVDQNIPQIVGIGPNGTGVNQDHEQVTWEIAFATELLSGSNIIEVRGSQYRVDSGTGDIILCDGPGSENQAHLDVYVIYSRIP